VYQRLRPWSGTKNQSDISLTPPLIFAGERCEKNGLAKCVESLATQPDVFAEIWYRLVHYAPHDRSPERLAGWDGRPQVAMQR